MHHRLEYKCNIHSIMRTKDGTLKIKDDIIGKCYYLRIPIIETTIYGNHNLLKLLSIERIIH